MILGGGNRYQFDKKHISAQALCKFSNYKEICDVINRIILRRHGVSKINV